MIKNIRILIIAFLAVAAISSLYLAVPVTMSFVVSHIFVCVSVLCTAASFIFFGKGSAKSIAGISYSVLAFGYVIASALFSIIGCLLLSGRMTLVGHIVILSLYLILTISSAIGSDYINKIDSENAEQNAVFEKEKNDYWKK